MLLRWGINSVAAVLLFTGLWWLLQVQSSPPPAKETLQIRKLATASLPPPPPPPPSHPRQQQTAAVNLQLSEAAAATQLRVTALDVPLPALATPNALSIVSAVEAMSFNSESLMTTLTTFSLDELDAMPKLLTPIAARLPGQLRQNGVREAKLQLHVIIHENGKVELVNVELAEYPELLPLVPKIVSQARFSSPRRERTKVKAEFLWPLKVS